MNNAFVSEPADIPQFEAIRKDRGTQNDGNTFHLKTTSIIIANILAIGFLFTSCLSQKKVMLLQDQNSAVKNNFMGLNAVTVSNEAFSLLDKNPVELLI